MTEKNNKKICLITPGHLATNPRLVKEIDALTQVGYNVHVVFTQYMDYLLKDDNLILTKYPMLTFDKLNWTKGARVSRASTGVAQKMSKWLSKLFSGYTTLHKIILNRNYSWQLQKAIQAKADLYIAHNSGALPIAADAAQKNKTLFAFDAEDFHRQEVSDNINSNEYRLLKFIEDLYLPKVSYLTTASPLIAKAYKKIYPNLNPSTINNVFSSSFFNKVAFQIEDSELKLFWFSQTIGKDRGIEDALAAIGLLNNPSISLTLLGNINNLNRDYFKKISKELGLAESQLTFLSPIHPDAIFELAYHYDIGLALERSSPLNRNICLTNKIFTYLTSGLAVIASETLAQKEFLLQNPAIGESYPIGNIEALARVIDMYDINRQLLHQTKLASYYLAETSMNWEIESVKFMKLVDKTLQD